MNNSYSISLTINLNEHSQSSVSRADCSSPGEFPKLPNPFEYVGIWHNEFLEATRGSKGSSVEEISQQAREWFSKRVGHDVGDLTELVRKAIGRDIYQTIGEIRHSARVYGYLKNMADALFKPDKMDLANVAATLVQIERRVLADSQITKAERAIVLPPLSIALHSLDYWSRNPHEIEPEDNPDGGTAKIDWSKFWDRFWKVVTVVAVDVAAAVFVELAVPGGGTILVPVVAAAASGTMRDQ